MVAVEVLESVGNRAMAYFPRSKQSGLDDPHAARYAKAPQPNRGDPDGPGALSRAQAAFAEAYDRASGPGDAAIPTTGT